MTSRLWNFCPFCGECLGCGDNLAIIQYGGSKGNQRQETACCDQLLAGEEVEDLVQAERKSQLAEMADDLEDELKALDDAMKNEAENENEIGLVDY